MVDVATVPLPSPSLAGGSPLYVTGEDTIRLTAFNSAAGVTVTLQGRFLAVRQRDDEGDPRPVAFRLDLIPTTNRLASTRLQNLAEGWLLDWSVVISAGTPATGQCYVKLQLVRGTSGAIQALALLAQGYITTSQELGPWGIGGSGFTNGAGALRSITGTTPAAGAEISETVPTGARWDLLAFKYQLTTSAVAGNRFSDLLFNDGTNYFCISDTLVQIANIPRDYHRTPGVILAYADASNDRRHGTVPSGLRLGSGYTIKTVTGGLLAGDQYSAIQYVVREWIEGN